MSSRWIHALIERVRAIVLPGRAERDLDEELSFHIAMQTRTNREAGMSEDEASRRARIALGGVEPLKEYSRDVRPLRWWRDFAAEDAAAGRYDAVSATHDRRCDR